MIETKKLIYIYCNVNIQERHLYETNIYIYVHSVSFSYYNNVDGVIF